MVVRIHIKAPTWVNIAMAPAAPPPSARFPALFKISPHVCCCPGGWKKVQKIVGKSVKTKERMGHRFQQRKPGQTHTSKHKHQADTSLKDNNHHLHLSAFHLSQLSGENTYLFRGRRFDMMLFSVFVFMMIQTKVVGRVTSRSVLP